MPTLIQGGTVVNADGQQRADVLIEQGVITQVAPEIVVDNARTIAAHGQYVLPGLIDPHVHFNEPGRTEWEGLATGTRALAVGGITSFFDMPLNSSPPVTTVAAYDAKRALMDSKALVNGFLWGGLIPGNLHELHGLSARGVIGFKAFMSNSGIDEFPAVDDDTLYEGMKIVAALGGIVAVHAENDSLTGAQAQRAQANGATSVRAYLDSRPSVAEAEAIQRALFFAQETGCKLYVVHTSTAHGADLIHAARAVGVDATCETCPHYLTLTDADMEHLGAVAKCAPPLRSAGERALLWQALLDGRVHTLGSDHSPSAQDLKDNPNFFRVWGGISGCQSTLQLLLTEGYFQRGLLLEQIVALTSANTARTFGLSAKGRIATGMDADLALVDIHATSTLRAEDLYYRHAVSPYVGRTLRGRVMQTLVGGETVYHEGTFARWVN